MGQLYCKLDGLIAAVGASCVQSIGN